MVRDRGLVVAPQDVSRCQIVVQVCHGFMRTWGLGDLRRNDFWGEEILRVLSSFFQVGHMREPCLISFSIVSFFDLTALTAFILMFYHCMYANCRF